MAKHYIALIHKEDRSCYGISFPDFPGVTAAAGTLDDALREAGVALGFALEDWQGPHPVPRSLDELRTNRDFLEWSADAIIAAVAPATGMADAA